MRVHYTNGKKIRKDSPVSYGHYVSVYLTLEQYEFLQSECIKLNMKGSAYMRELLAQVMEDAKEYIKKGGYRNESPSL